MEDVVSWRAVTVGCPVIASDGADVGKVVEVAALDKEDIFHGIAFHHHVLGKAFLAPAADIANITTTAVHLTVTGSAAEKYEEFHELHVESLGLKGMFFWKHLGWKDSNK